MTKILACIAVVLFGLSACDTGWKARVAQSGKFGVAAPDW
jgi:hypothetical protein